jgi:UDP-glucose-4-epimerase GalE
LRVLLTGGAGYIGSITLRRLVASGHDVVVLDDLSSGVAQAVDGAPLVVGSVLDQPLVERVLADHQVDAVVHFAGLKSAPASVADPGAYFATNLAGSLSVLRAMAARDVRSFVFSSTCAVYGNATTLPVDESTPTAPLNPYAESKLLVERLLPWFEAAHGIRSMALRYFNAAGAALDGSAGESWVAAGNVIPAALRVAAEVDPVFHIHGTDLPTADGSAIRDYVHVEDLARAHEAALMTLADGAGSDTINLGRGVPTSVREIITTIEAVTGRALPIVEGPPRAGDPIALWADPRRAKAILGWTAALDLESMIATAWRWHTTGRPDLP